MKVWIGAIAFAFAGMNACAPVPASLTGYSREIVVKQNEIDGIEHEIHDLRRLTSDSLAPRRIDSLEVRKARAQNELLDLKFSGDREGLRYQEAVKAATYDSRHDPKPHPIK